MNTPRWLAGAALALLVVAAITVAFWPNADRLAGADSDVPSPTPYHEGAPSPVASPDQGRNLPLPPAEDLDTLNSMTAAGIAMIQAAQSMEAAAAVMVASGVQSLVDLGGHWYQDARALRDQGVWMSMTATSDSMVHDPKKARELNLSNLNANGAVMQAEGEAMAQHAREMLAQVDQLRSSGALPATVADDLATRGNGMISIGDQMAQDGEQMQDDAERLGRSLGL